MKHLPTALRRAAILIDTLDPQTADALMDQMAPAQAARIRQAVMELDPVNHAERNDVLQSFVRRDDDHSEPPNNVPSKQNSGIEIDESLAAKIAAGPANEATPDEPRSPFRFLQDATSESLAAFLREEHPQTIAVVLSQVSTERAAEVLEDLGPNVQSDVVFRLTQLNETAPDILAEISQELEFRLSNESHTRQRRFAGISAVRAILQQTSPVTRDQIVNELADRDQKLAEQIATAAPVTPFHPPRNRIEESQHESPSILKSHDLGEKNESVSWTRRPRSPVNGEQEVQQRRTASASPTSLDQNSVNPSTAGPELTHPAADVVPVVDFDDLDRLGDASLARIFAHVDPKITLLALAGARPEFVDRILRKLTAREARALRKKIGRHGPMQLRDVDRAQQHIVNTAARLLTAESQFLPA